MHTIICTKVFGLTVRDAYRPFGFNGLVLDATDYGDYAAGYRKPNYPVPAKLNFMFNPIERYREILLSIRINPLTVRELLF